MEASEDKSNEVWVCLRLGISLAVGSPVYEDVRSIYSNNR